MLKELINECRITFKLSTQGPLLIKGRENPPTAIIAAAKADCSLHPREDPPNMIFVRTFQNGSYQPVIPGSSLKGVMRSHCEKITRTLMPPDDSNENMLGCCNPFITEENQNTLELFCGYKFKLRKATDEDIATSAIFRESCPICKVFGNTYLRSRIYIPDGYIVADTKQMQVRDGVGIDRYSGGAAQFEQSGAKFNLEVAENAIFIFHDIVIQNFDLWQLGLLAYLFQDFQDNLIKIGYGKSRGLGSVHGEIEKIEISYFGVRKPEDRKLIGIAHFYKDRDYYTSQERESIVTEIDLPDDISKDLISDGYRHQYKFLTSESAMRLLQSTASCFSSSDNSGYMNGSGYTVPRAMQPTEISSLLNHVEHEQAEEGESE